MGLKELVEISNKYGKNPNLVLAGGGNTSFKDDKTLYIKGSGTTLATITTEGFVELDRKALGAMWTKDYPENGKEREDAVLEDLMNARAASSKSKRPVSYTHLIFTLYKRNLTIKRNIYNNFCGAKGCCCVSFENFN